MHLRDFHLSLADVPGASTRERIIQSLKTAVLDGRLPPGTVLPGFRQLGERLGVNRQTVAAAVQELEIQGWVEILPNRGTRVAPELPSGEGNPGAEPTVDAGFDLPSRLQPVSSLPPGGLLLADGAADSRLAPAEDLARGYRHFLKERSGDLADGWDPLGILPLREALASWLSTHHGVVIDPTRIMVTRGSRNALRLLAETLFRPGDRIAVEDPGNRGAWDVLRTTAGMELRPLPVDDRGLDPRGFEALLEKERVRAIYLTPRRQFPTGVSLPRERALAILQSARQHRVAVLEDDYDGAFTYGVTSVPSLLAQDVSGQVVHIGSLSRLVAPGVRLGFMVVPAPLVPALAKVKRRRDEAGDAAFEWAIAELIRDGGLDRHLLKARKIYEERRNLLVSLLRGRLGAHLDVDVPEGGMGLWVRVRPPVDAEGWVKMARAGGLVLNPPSYFHVGPSRGAFRIGFTQADASELAEAVERLVSALRKSGTWATQSY
jgi:GntR family transcriptional regulator / MocR family aminotransferase